MAGRATTGSAATGAPTIARTGAGTTMSARATGAEVAAGPARAVAVGPAAAAVGGPVAAAAAKAGVGGSTGPRERRGPSAHAVVSWTHGNEDRPPIPDLLPRARRHRDAGLA